MNDFLEFLGLATLIGVTGFLILLATGLIEFEISHYGSDDED